MQFHIVTIFPDIFSSYFSESILKRAQAKKAVAIRTHDLRSWADGSHGQVDDRPYGGGAGMVLMAQPIISAITEIKSKLKSKKSPPKAGQPRAGKSKIQNTKIILLSAKGKAWSQALAKKYAKLDNIILICGRYEGVDERITKFIDEEISVGDYVLTGGEIPAMVIVDSITRLLPGVLGNATSAEHESHAIPHILEHPHYTRPEILETGGKKLKVPKVLLSGDHEKIKTWRDKKSKHR